MASAVAARSGFSWLKGRTEVYPLIKVMALGVGMVGYITTRQFYSNPEISVWKSTRLAGPVDDNGVTEQRAKEHSNSIFRSMGEGKKKTVF